MILSKKDLQEYILADRSRYASYSRHSNLLIRLKKILKNLFGIQTDEYYACKYLYVLRHYEYYFNNVNNGHLYFILSKLYSFQHKRLSRKYRIFIEPNTVGKGLYIPHFSGSIICNCKQMGDNCIISTGVVVGNKCGQDNRPIIGNNVELCIGCKIIGKINIADNAIVAPNSVVVKDVPMNAIVSGIPAKIIKMKNSTF